MKKQVQNPKLKNIKCKKEDGKVFWKESWHCEFTYAFHGKKISYFWICDWAVKV